MDVSLAERAVVHSQVFVDFNFLDGKCQDSGHLAALQLAVITVQKKYSQNF